MVATITLFANNTSPTGPQLDGNFTAYTPLTTIPCSVAGTNTLTLTQLANTPTLSAYQNYVQYSGVVAVTNTGPTTAQVGSLGALPVYKDTAAGVSALSGAELTAGCAFTLLYDSALNSGNGGWHLSSGPAFNTGTLNISTLGVTYFSASVASLTSLKVGGATVATVSRILSGFGTLTYTVTPANAVQDQNLVVAGTQIADVVSLGVGPVNPSGAGFTGFCGTVGTVTVRLLNPTGSSISLTTVTVRAMTMGLTP